MRRLRQGDPVVVGSLTLTPIEQVTVWGHHGYKHLTAGGSKLPVAIVIRSAVTTWALDLDGRQVDLDSLLRDVISSR